MYSRPIRLLGWTYLLYNGRLWQPCLESTQGFTYKLLWSSLLMAFLSGWMEFTSDLWIFLLLYDHLMAWTPSTEEDHESLNSKGVFIHYFIHSLLPLSICLVCYFLDFTCKSVLKQFPFALSMSLPPCWPSPAVEPAVKEAEVSRRFSLASSLASSSSSSFPKRRTKGTLLTLQSLPASTFGYFYHFLLWKSFSLLFTSHCTYSKLTHVTTVCTKLRQVEKE